jgi:hypothetical protein
VAYELLTRNPYLMQGGTFLWDELAAVALLDPAVVTWREMTVLVEGEGSSGGHVQRDPDGAEALISTDVNPGAATSRFIEALSLGRPRADPFELAGDLAASWDGTSCTADATGETRPGAYRLTFANDSADFAGFALVRVAPPHTWEELHELAAQLDPATGEAPPAWIGVMGQVQADAGQSAPAIVQVDSGLVGPVCAAADGDALASYHVGEPVTIAP